MGDVRLHLAASLRDAASGPIGAWFAAASRHALDDNRPTGAVFPNAAAAAIWKRRLVDARLPLVGVAFWTPGRLRDALHRASPDRPTLAVREDLHLLLAAAALRFPDIPAARAIARDPAPLMRALDALSAAGWPWSELGIPALDPLLQEFRASIARLGWTLVSEADRAFGPPPPDPPLNRLLVLGFDASHSDAYPLLDAAASRAAACDVVLTLPRAEFEGPDQAWVGTWEERFGAASDVPAATAPGPFSPLAEHIENPTPGAAVGPGVALRIGRDLRSQARLAAREAAAAIEVDPAASVVICCPGYSALSRETASALEALGLPFHDGIGFHAPADGNTLAWRAWLDLQAQPTPARAAAYWRAIGLPPPQRRRLERAIADAQGELQVDDLGLLVEWLCARAPDPACPIVDFAEELRFLPAQGPFDHMLRIANEEARHRGWRAIAAELDRHAARLAGLEDTALPRATVLAWIGGIAEAARRTRTTDTNHPFARVHLVGYPAAEHGDWSHVILTGMNEGVWPGPERRLPFLSDPIVEDLNARAIGTGRQGEGHRILRDGHTLLLTESHRRAATLRQFCTLLETAAAGVAACASTFDESDPERRLPPSDLLIHLAFRQSGDLLSEARMDELAAAGAVALAATAFPAPTPPDDALAAEVRRVAGIRRDDSQPFGVYEFALSAPPPRPITLSCRGWADAIRQPATAWLRAVLGVEAPPDAEEDTWSRTLGTWVHRWIARSLERPGGAFGPLPDNWRERVRDHAAATRDAVALFLRRRGRTLGEPWLAGWSEAVSAADRIARSLDAIRDWTHGAAEWVLADGATLPTGAGALRLRGRVDLLLAKSMPDSIPGEAWILDFKTGEDQPLSPKTFRKALVKSSGGQLALYAYGLRALGSARAHFTVLTPDAVAQPQMSDADADAFADCWAELARMQATGVFGMIEAPWKEYGRSATVPLAFRAIDPAILAAKWRLTHPALAEDGGGE